MRNRSLQAEELLKTNDYQILNEWTVSRTLAIPFFGIWVAAFFVFLILFTGVYVLFTSRQGEVSFGSQWGHWLGWLLAPLLVTAPVPLHELIHGVVMSFYGGKPRYGVGVLHFVLPYAYVTTAKVFTRGQFLQIALAPLVVLSLVGLLIMVLLQSSWLVIPLAANAAGAILDVWMSILLLCYPRHILVEDHRTGLRIYGKKGDRALQRPSAKLFRNFLTAFGICFALCFVFSFILPFVLPALGVRTFSIGLQDTPFYLYRWHHESGSGISSSMGILGVLALSSAIGLLYGFVRSVVHRKGSPEDPGL